MRRIDRLVFPLLVMVALSVAACGERPAQPAATPATLAPAEPTATATTPAEAESPLPTPTTAGDAESPLPAPTETVSATATVTATTGLDMTTLRDEYAGFAIDYPTGWTVLEPPLEVREDAIIYSITLQSWPLEEPGTQGIPEGGSKMDISVSKSAAATLEAALAAYRTELTQTELPVEVVSEEPRELADGLSGAAFEIKNAQGDVFHNFVTAINGHRVLLSSLGDRAIFDAMVQTLRALPQDPG